MRRSLIVVGLVLLLGIGGTIAWRLWPMQRVFYTDADTIKAPTHAAAIRQILWQPPRYRPDLTRAFAADHVPFVTEDGLTLLFSRRDHGHPANIYYARKSASGWSEPVALTAVNSDSDDLGPVLSNDGRALYFYSDRAGSIGGYDLWVSYRHSGEAFEFDEAINLGAAVNSPFNDYAPAPTPDGDLLYFSSNRPPPEDELGEQARSATLHEDSFERTYDLYVSAVTGQRVGSARPLRTLNTPANEGAPAVSPVGDFLYFASDRAGGRGGFDLYRSRRLEGLLEAAHNLGETVNSAFHDLDPSVGHGGFDLYFSSDRSVGDPIAERDSPREYKLYHTISREVFVDSEVIQRAPIRWAAIWSAIWPNLLWMLTAFTLAVLLFTLMRRSGERRLSLLMRCLLGSVLAHLVLVMLLTIWGVTASIAGEYSRRGRIQIALASPATGQEVAAQITGGLTTLESPMIASPSFERAETPKERPVEASEARLEVSHQVVPVDPSPDVEMTLADAGATWQSESRAWSKPKALRPPSAEVSLSTPTESLRVSRQESTRKVSPSETPVEDVKRPEVVVTAEPQPTQSVAVELARLDQLPVMRKGLIERVVAGDAVVPKARVVDDLSVPRPTSDLPPAPGFPLATATAEKLPDVAEIRLDPSERTRTVPPLRITSHGGSGPIPDEFANIQPEATESAEDVGRSLAGSSLAQASDAIPVSATVTRPEVAVDITPSSAEPADVSTPQELVKMARATEGAVRVDPTVRPEVIRAETLPVHVEPSEMRFDRMDPVRAPSVVGEALMVSVRRGGELDKDIPFVPLAKPTAALAASVWPERKAIELPPVEEAREAQTFESKEPVERVAMADLRADVDSWLSQAVREVHRPHVDVELSREEVAVAPDTSFFPTPTVPDDLAPVKPVSYVATIPVDIPDDQKPMELDLELSPEESPPENAFLQRSAPNKMEIVERMGGSEATEAAVALALKWLAQHQDAEGFWNIRVFDERCGGCDHTQPIHADVALTGLATLCFLGAGHTQDSGGPYEATVGRAIDWLLAQQAPNGDLRGDETMYTQGIATIALAEALAMTDDERLREPVEWALRFIHAARSRHEGGWQYDPTQASDTSVLGWMMMAMKSASTAGLPVPRDAFDVGTDWLERVSDPDQPGLYPFRPDQQASPGMTAESMFVQQILGKTAADPIMQASADYILEHLPDWDRNPDTYFWYYASLALFQHQGPAWTTWNNALKRELVAHQRKDDQAAGSWDPQGNQWSELGGRVYQTALCTLMLEVYYRYLPMYSNDDPTIPDRPDDAFGTIAGVVRDADTGKPLVGATVRLDVPDGAPILAQTDRDGFYYLWTPELPPFFALSAAQQGYVPESLNVDSTALRQSVLDVDFDLRSDRGVVFSTEAVPEVHHLGDNRFDGKINSRFQKRTEGAEYGSEFVITSEQLARRFRRAEVRLMAKGVQRGHSLFINGIMLDDKLERAPRDGSFGDFRARFDPNILRAGTNTIDLIAKPSNTDIDDFEFVNVQIHLFP